MPITAECRGAGDGRNRDIECLRAVAVMGVAVHHVQDNLFHPGLPWITRLFTHAQFWFGVDLFLAISGFVIARSLLPQMDRSTGNLRAQAGVVGAFWIRRFWRLLPSAWFWLGAMLLASAVFNRSGAFGSIHANLMATLAGMFNVANFRLADSLFRYEYGASFVYWSLSLEEQFYLLLPLLVFVLRKRIDILMAALVLIQLLVLRTPLLMMIRTDALALGVLLAVVAPGRAYAAMNPRFLLRIGVLRVLLPCLLLACLAWLVATGQQALPLRITIIAAAATVLVWLASYDCDYLLPEGSFKGILVWIGARSYAIYLIHVPVYFLLRELDFRLGYSPPAWLLFLLAIGLIALLADLNYRYIEQPLRERGRRLAGNFARHREGQGLVPIEPALLPASGSGNKGD